MWFPEIGNQDRIGSCTSFASTYYQMTYTVNKTENRNGKDSANVCSPKWTYNLINGGDDNGSWISSNFAAIKSVGVASMKDFPYIGSKSDPRNYRQWCTDEATWKDAQKYTIDEMGYVPLSNHISGPDDEDLQPLKTKLANGEILTFSTYWYSWNFSYIDDIEDDSSDDDHVGELIGIYCDNTYSGGHALTIVGYDDNIWVDINGNNKVDQGEKGALKIANSWGSNWGNDGFVWVAYDMLNRYTEVPNNPLSDNNRHQLTKDINGAYWITTKPFSEKSNLFAKVKLNTAKRSDIQATIKAKNKETGTEYTYTPYPLNRVGGSYSFDGTTSASDCTFVFDLSKLIDGVTEEDLYKNDWSIDIQDCSNNNNPVIVEDFKILDDFSGKIYNSNITSSIKLDGSGTTLKVEFNKTSAPTNLYATKVDNSNIKLQWTAPKGDNTSIYEVYCNDSLLGTTNELSYIDKYSNDGSIKKYEVIAVDNNGNKSNKSSKTTIGGKSVTIYYNKYINPNIHYSIENNQWTTVPGVAMNPSNTLNGYSEFTIDLGDEISVEACFNDGSGNWDNNNSKNYIFNSGSYILNDGKITSFTVPLKINEFKTVNYYNPSEDKSWGYIYDSVGFSVNTSGGYGKYKYRFGYNILGTYYMIQDYSENSSPYFYPTRVFPYTMIVDVMDEEGNVTTSNYIYNSFDHLTMEDLSVEGEKVAHKPLTITATTSGGSYGENWGRKYTVYTILGNTKTILSDNSSDRTKHEFNWTPTTAGDYIIGVEITDTLTGEHVTKETNITVNSATYEPLEIKDFKTVSFYDFSKDQPWGYTNGKVSFYVNATGGYGSYKYRFGYNNRGIYHLIQDYSEDTSVYFEPNEVFPYTMVVDVMDEDGNVATSYCTYNVYDRMKIDDFTVQGSNKVNSPVSLTANISGGGYTAIDKHYSFYVIHNNTKTFIAENSSENNTSWIPTKSGIYTLGVEVTDTATNSTVTSETQYTVESDNIAVIYYKNSSNWTNVYFHYKKGNGEWTTAPGELMKDSTTKPGYKEITIELDDSSELIGCFTDGYGNWDSKYSENYSFGKGSYICENWEVTKID